MSGEGYGYPNPSGTEEYILEGFKFVLVGYNGRCAITPNRLYWPSIRDRESNWVGAAVEISGQGPNDESFQCSFGFEGSSAMFTRLISDVEQMKLGEVNELIFPRTDAFSDIRFTFRIIRDGTKSTHWAMHFKSALPAGLDGDYPPSCVYGNFAGTLNLVTSFDPDCLEVVRLDLASFLRWLECEK